MQYRTVLAGTAAALSLMLASSSIVLAKDNEQDGEQDRVQVTASAHVEASTTRIGQREDSSDIQDRGDDNKDEHASSTTASSARDADNINEGDNNDSDEGERHQKNIETITHALKELAGGDQNIDEDVQHIADEEASSSETAGKAMSAVAQRGFLLSFLLGSDFKNLGVLKSTLEVTQNHIDQLSAAKEKTVDADVKAGIDTQITALQKANADAEAFVKAHEDSFSVLGWFFKLFSK